MATATVLQAFTIGYEDTLGQQVDDSVTTESTYDGTDTVYGSLIAQKQTQNIGTGALEALDIGEMTYAGILFLRNLSTESAVTIYRANDAAQPVTYLLPGEWTRLRGVIINTTYYAKAATATAPLLVLALS